VGQQCEVDGFSGSAAGKLRLDVKLLCSFDLDLILYHQEAYRSNKC